MSEVGYVTTGETPAMRSLAAVLRDEFSGTDDAVRLIVATSVATPQPECRQYIRLNINGQTIKVPGLNDANVLSPSEVPGGTPAGIVVFVLVTRTQMLAIGTPGIA